jgi:hypothetical protein
MKMLIKSNKKCSNIPPLQNIIQDEVLEEIVYGDDDLLKIIWRGAAIFSGQIFNIL